MVMTSSTAAPERAAGNHDDPWLAWRPQRPEEQSTLSVAELADCCCPDLCDRDHANE